MSHTHYVHCSIFDHRTPPRLTGPEEKEVVVHFINEVGERWRSVSVELQCLRSMLEEVRTNVPFILYVIVRTVALGFRGAAG